MVSGYTSGHIRDKYLPRGAGCGSSIYVGIRNFGRAILCLCCLLLRCRVWRVLFLWLAYSDVGNKGGSDANLWSGSTGGMGAVVSLGGTLLEFSLGRGFWVGAIFSQSGGWGGGGRGERKGFVDFFCGRQRDWVRGGRGYKPCVMASR